VASRYPAGPARATGPGCAHLTLWHGEHGQYRGKPCRQCDCPAYVAQPEGAAILSQLQAVLTRYVIHALGPGHHRPWALWIAATHAQAAWQHAPRLVIRAPVKRCGKSRLLDIVEGTCHAPLITVNASPAAVYQRHRHRHGAHAAGGRGRHDLRRQECRRQRGPAWPAERRAPAQPARHPVGTPGTRSLETIPTFAMAALAGIGAMPDTIEDRVRGDQDGAAAARVNQWPRSGTAGTGPRSPRPRPG